MHKADFVFFHGYHEKLWDGFVKAGLLNRNAGVRFCQNILLPESRKFNSLAVQDGKLSHLIGDNAMPWYIDRLQGGVYIEEYPYDRERIASLGGEFYGFQLHEWVSNLLSDYNKLQALPETDWTEEKITAEILRRFPFPQLFLEAATAKEYAELFPVPNSMDALLDNAQKLFAMRSRYTAGRLLPCDSVMMAPNLEFKAGAERIMPEIGAQTPGANIQLSYARGMAKAYRKSFGAYYEPWGGNPFSVCNYQKNGSNEWNIVDDDFPFRACADKGGSSRSLQKRLCLYAYLAGASFMSEEWGLFNTFLDCEDFVLSPYGTTKRDFLRFVEKYPAGELYAPIAVVLPKDMLLLSNEACRSWFTMPQYTEAGRNVRDAAVERAINSLLFSSAPQYGNENKTLPASNVPDAFDIIHEDCETAFAGYRYLVDLTGNPAFAKKHRNLLSPDEAKRRASQRLR